MIDEHTEELASAYVIGALDAAETATFEARLRDDSELRAMVRTLREVTQMLAGTSPALQPPVTSRQRLIVGLQGRPLRQSAALPSYRVWLPWALAAGFAIACVALGWQANGLYRQLDSWRRQVDALTILTVQLRNESGDLRHTVSLLQQSNRLANMRIALLTSQLRADPKALAVSVWDNNRQTGVIVVRNLKPPPKNKDFQLWIIDPRYKTPVDAGVFQVDAAGDGRAQFNAKLPIQNANQFAVTEEMKGGAPVPTLSALVLAGT